MQMLTLDKFEEASEKVKEVTLETKLVYSEYLSGQSGNKVYLKPENLQYTGAYKVRGAYYKISTLSDEERKKGLITASAGNHAQGVAYAAKCYGVKAVIVMPTTTPLIKVNRTKGYGAEVILHGDVYDEACEYALKLAEEKGFSQVLWLDGVEKKYVEEVGSMNIMFKIDGKIYTAACTGTVLPGVTRRSIIELLKDWGYEVIEGKLAIADVMKAAEEGKLEEVFGTGTAAVVSPVKELDWEGKVANISGGKIGPLTQKLYDTLTGIQWGKLPDTKGWTVKVEPKV